MCIRDSSSTTSKELVFKYTLFTFLLLFHLLSFPSNCSLRIAHVSTHIPVFLRLPLVPIPTLLVRHLYVPYWCPNNSAFFFFQSLLLWFVCKSHLFSVFTHRVTITFNCLKFPYPYLHRPVRHVEVTTSM